MNPLPPAPPLRTDVAALQLEPPERDANHSLAAVQSVRYGSAAGRWLLPRVLHLLSFDNEGGVVGQAVDSRANEVCTLP